MFNSLDKQEGAQERGQKDQTTALNDYDWLISIETTNQDLSKIKIQRDRHYLNITAVTLGQSLAKCLVHNYLVDFIL